MPAFRYQTIDKLGRSLTGVMPARDEMDLEQKLRELGLWLTESAMERSGSADGDARKSKFNWLKLGGKPKRRELIDFCTLLTVQVQAGVPLVQSLEATVEDCADPKFREVITQLQAHVESGLEFHEALERFPGVFTSHFVSVVRAGVVSGKLPETLKDLKHYLEWVEQMMGDVRQASIYPAIVSSIVACFTAFLFTIIIPKFAVLLDKMHVQRPLLTQIVLGISSHVRSTWWIWLPLLVGAIVIVPLGRKVSPRFALLLDRIKLRLPVLGPINLMLALSRFAHNFSILYRSGIPVLETLNQCQHGLIGNTHVEAAVGSVANDVKTGSTISEAMHRQPVFSSMLVRMVSLGESTGRLDMALDTVAEHYNDIIPRRIKALFSILEPALMLFLIFIIGIVALAIYLPIISLMGSMH
jgi:type IV pilus assembly protein PilC